jgi:acetyl-CoA carboxylase biotin carboxyl carrier protein
MSRTAKGREDELVDVEAHITGTVWKTEVAVGDTVSESDFLVVLDD